MKRLALILDLEGRPVDRADLELMLDAAGVEAPRAACVWVDGPVALGAVGPGSDGPGPPGGTVLTPDPAGRRIILDGRVDNAGELRGRLARRGADVAAGTDEQLILGAYGHWGAGCAAEIVGDFSFLLWDPAERRLLGVRDALGLKPLVYCRVGSTFYAASEIRQLLAVPAVPREPNEGMVGEYLAESITDNEETLYDSVRRLPPAHLLTVRSGDPVVERYWEADPGPELSLAGDAEFAERLLELLTEAVRCRVRDRTTVAAHLSGGVDSTGVVGLARRLQRSPQGRPFRLQCFASTYESRPEADETAQITAAAEYFGLRPHLTPAGRPGRADFAAWAARDGEFPPYPGDLSADPLMAAVRACGCTVLLTGNGGDEWFWGFEDPRARLAPRLASASTLEERLLLGRRLTAAVLTSLLPPRVVGVLRRLSRRRPRVPWIPRDFRRRIELDDRLRRAAGRVGLPRSPRERTAVALDHGAMVHGREVAERYAAAFGIEERHPFHDRRVIEFALALPPDQVVRGGTHKLVLRAALAGSAPDSSRLRQDKAEFSHLVAEALLGDSIAGLLEEPAIAGRGWVSAEQVRAMFLEMKRLYEAGSPGYRRLMWPLWMVFGIETWYREAFPSA